MSVYLPSLPPPDSGSSCSLAAGLESLGLTDIRTLVRLMCLAAAGRAGLSTSSCAASVSSERARGGHSKMSKPISCLAYLSTAVGCLASSTPSAAKLLVQLCTQVGRPLPPSLLGNSCFSLSKHLSWEIMGTCARGGVWNLGSGIQGNQALVTGGRSQGAPLLSLPLPPAEAASVLFCCA